jgi:DNA invertase Pin-like site-specific DNA recombinase
VTTKTAIKTRKAIGIVRVSQTGGRAGESFVSPTEQAERIADACKRDGLKLTETIEELDVSGGTPLAERAGLRHAVEAVEAGDAQVIVAAYFDRLVRSLKVQDELVARVEAAGGQVLAVDVGKVTNGSAGQWLSSTAIGMVSEYQRRSSAERSAEGQAAAIARGAIPFPNVPPGYIRGADGVLTRDPATAPIVAEAFARRAAGATIAEVRAYLTGKGIRRSYHGVTALLGSRIMLGEVHFGDYEPNLSAHEAIVERDVWQAVQRVRAPRGRRPKSELLLARLGVLRCASCGGRMVVGTQTQNGRSYPFYRCGHVRGDCPQRVTISAELVEGLVIDKVEDLLANRKGRASAAAAARRTVAEFDAAQAKYDAGMRAFADHTDESAAIETLAKLRAARDAKRERVDQLGDGLDVVVTAADIRDAPADIQRRLIRSTIAKITVAPGRGAGRVSFEPLS